MKIAGGKTSDNGSDVNPPNKLVIKPNDLIWACTADVVCGAWCAVRGVWCVVQVRGVRCGCVVDRHRIVEVVVVVGMEVVVVVLKWNMLL